MKLEEQVCNLELSKKLKELGVEQDSYFWYTLPEGKYVQKFMELNPAYEDDEDAPTKVQLTAQPDFYGIYGEPVTKVSAFTVAELGEMLPNNSVELSIDYHKQDKAYWVIAREEMRDIYMVGGEETEADARAKMFIWLIENNYLEIKKGK